MTFDEVFAQIVELLQREGRVTYRALKPRGVFLFNVWDRLEENDFAATVTAALAPLFPNDPPRFFERTLHGYYDQETIMRDLVKGGFTASPEVTTLTVRGQTKSAQLVAVAFCQGTPLRNEIETRDAARLEEATAVVAEALAQRFGRRAIEGKLQAHIIRVEA